MYTSGQPAPLDVLRKPQEFDSQFPGIIESLDVLRKRMETLNSRLSAKFAQLTGNSLLPPSQAETKSPSSIGYIAQTHEAISALCSEINTLETVGEAFTSL